MLYEFKGLRPYVHEEAYVHPQANVTGNVEIYEKQNEIFSKLEKIEDDVENTFKNSSENKAAVNKIKLTQEKLLASEGKYSFLEKE